MSFDESSLGDKAIQLQDLSAAPPEMVGRSRSSSDDLTPEEKAPFLASARLRSTEGPIFSYQNQDSVLPTVAGAAGGRTGNTVWRDEAQQLHPAGVYDGKTFPDSHTYEPEESEVWRAHESHFWTSGKSRAFKRWVLTFFIGILTGIIGVAVTWATRKLTSWKMKTVLGLMEQERTGESFVGSAFFTYAGINLAYVMVAYLMVVMEPIAAGSGIPEIKAFLNGVNLPRVVRVKTMICKMMGVTFTVGSGLPAGKEGPMVLAGSVVAAGVSQGKSTVMGFDTSFSRFQDFRNDREKRDFVSCGAAAGVAAAFGAPIGGVLFSLEEGASFWSNKLTYRAFFCAMMTVFMLFVVKTAEVLWGQPDSTKMFSFGQFFSYKGGGNYSVWELVLFILVGSIGGLVGAWFNGTNERLSIFRAKNIKTRGLRALEVMGISLAMSIITFGLPSLWSSCTPKPIDVSGWSDQEKTLLKSLVAFQCDPATSYNELASLFFTDSDTAIKHLFHFRELGAGDEPSFSTGALVLFLVFYLGMAVVTYGASVPSGLFVPSLLSGAALGRLFGRVLHRMDGASGTFADSGTYALVGAAAMLGGMARMTISLTVILLEATGDMQYVLPLMLTLMAARWVGNLFNEGLYDIHIKLKGYPVLEPDMPPAARKNLSIAQVMSRDLKTFRQVERVGVIYDTLLKTEHDCFPVVDPEQGGVLVGSVLRKALCVILQQKAFGHPDATGPEALELKAKQGKRVSPLLNWSTLERIYPRYPHINDIRILERDRQCVIDLRPFMNTAPYTVNVTASITRLYACYQDCMLELMGDLVSVLTCRLRTYRLFRTMGLRHLCVTNSKNQVVGFITRYDLLPEVLMARFAATAAAHTAGETQMVSRRPSLLSSSSSIVEDGPSSAEPLVGWQPGGANGNRSMRLV